MIIFRSKRHLPGIKCCHVFSSVSELSVFYDHLAKSTQLCYLCDVVAFDLVLDING